MRSQIDDVANLEGDERDAAEDFIVIQYFFLNSLGVADMPASHGLRPASADPKKYDTMVSSANILAGLVRFWSGWSGAQRNTSMSPLNLPGAPSKGGCRGASSKNSVPQSGSANKRSTNLSSAMSAIEG